MQYWLPNITSRIDSILVVILTLSSLNFYFFFLYSVYFDSSREISRSTYSYNFDETLLAELAGGTPSDPRKNHVLYQACPDRLLHRVHSWTNDLDHVLQVMRKAPKDGFLAIQPKPTSGAVFIFTLFKSRMCRSIDLFGFGHRKYSGHIYEKIKRSELNSHRTLNKCMKFVHCLDCENLLYRSLSYVRIN